MGGNAGQSAAYVFRNLDTASGTITQNIKLTASDGAADDRFGIAVSLDGDRFNIGAYFATGAAASSGKAYSGTVSSMTTLDAGNATGIISGLSFVSQDDWIIGRTTSANQVTLGKGDTANVSASGKGAFIGQNAGSNNNTLLVQGTVTTAKVTVSSATGATGNVLQIANDGGTTTAGTVTATGGIVVNNGGTLLLSGSGTVRDRIGNATPVTLNGGGKFSTGGLNEGTAPTAAGGSGGVVGIGALTLAGTTTTSRATIDFANTALGDALVFASLDAGGKGAFVSILNWSGAVLVDLGATANDRLLFVSNPGFSNADLANWQFSNDAGVSFGVGATQITYNGYYEIVPAFALVPEPGTWAAGLLASAGLVATRFRRGRPARRQPQG